MQLRLVGEKRQNRHHLPARQLRLDILPYAHACRRLRGDRTDIRPVAANDGVYRLNSQFAIYYIRRWPFGYERYSGRIHVRAILANEQQIKICQMADLYCSTCIDYDYRSVWGRSIHLRKFLRL